CGGGRLFERCFLRSVALCREPGRIEGPPLSLDGFPAEATAAPAGLRASLALAAADERGGDEPAEAEQPVPPAPPQLALAEPRSGPTPKRRSSNATSLSRTDPDAKLRGKPGQRPHPAYRRHVAVRPQAPRRGACLG